jgi:hypothetical protein
MVGPWHVQMAAAKTAASAELTAPWVVGVGVALGLGVGAVAVMVPLHAGIQALRRMEF